MLRYKFKDEYEKQRPFKVYFVKDGARIVFDSEKHSAKVAVRFPQYFEWVEEFISSKEENGGMEEITEKISDVVPQVIEIEEVTEVKPKQKPRGRKKKDDRE